MRKLHVITQKEMVKPQKLKECIAVVIDVFLATSTISFLLKNNYEPVYAMKDVERARTFFAEQTVDYMMLGERKGEPVDGFQYPDPTTIQLTKQRKAAIICSTNGTRAIEKAKNAKKMYISSLVNGHLVAERVHDISDESSIVLICSGNDARFSKEDFVGAGQIVDHLVKKGDYSLTDSSKVAREAYHCSKSKSFQDLLEGETASLLSSYGFPQSMNLVIDNVEKVNVLPVFNNNKIICEMK